jgi:hypothetical protein
MELFDTVPVAFVTPPDSAAEMSSGETPLLVEAVEVLLPVEVLLLLSGGVASVESRLLSTDLSWGEDASTY